MHKFFLILACLIITLPGWANPGPCFKNKKTVLKAVNQSKITDEVILLKKNGYFKSYTNLAGLRINKRTGTYLVKGDSIFLKLCMTGSVAESCAFGTIYMAELKLFFPDKAEVKHYVLYDVEQIKKKHRKTKNLPTVPMANSHTPFTKNADQIAFS